MNIYEKINKVRESVVYVKKDTSVGFGNNSFKRYHMIRLQALRGLIS
jgi:hypothetical protein